MKKTIGLATLAMMLVCGRAEAGLLTFDGDIGSAAADGSGAFIAPVNYTAINQAYGDTSTVDVTYIDLIRTGESLKFWANDYNDLTNVAWGGNGDGDGQSWDRIEIRGLVGQTISLDSFDMGAYSDTHRLSNVVIYDLLGNVLKDYGKLQIGSDDGLTSTHFAPGVVAQGGIAIEWKDTGYNVGIDNIAFTEGRGIVPEPATIVMMGAGLGAAGLIRLRRRGR